MVASRTPSLLQLDKPWQQTIKIKTEHNLQPNKMEKEVVAASILMEVEPRIDWISFVIDEETMLHESEERVGIGDES